MNGNLSGRAERRRSLLRTAAVLPFLGAVAAALPIGRVDLGPGFGMRPTAAEWAASIDRLLEASPLTLRPTDGAVLTLRDGRVWWGARVVAIGGVIATVSHDGGLVGVAVDAIPERELQRAEAEMAAALKQARQWDADETEREIERTKATLLAAQRALLVAPPAAPGSAGTAARVTVAPAAAGEVVEAVKTTPEQRLALLKRKFPLRTKGRTDRGLEFDIPSTEVWLFYRRTLEAATVATLPETLAYMESRLNQNLDIWHWRAKTTESMPQSREHLVAARTQAWLDRTLRAFLADARLATREY